MQIGTVVPGLQIGRQGRAFVGQMHPHAFCRPVLGGALHGLDDFNLAVIELTQTEAVVSSMVLGYWFLGDKIEWAFRKVALSENNNANTPGRRQAHGSIYYEPTDFEHA